MPLPEQVVERLGREPVRTPGWSGQLLMFAATIFFISLAIYLGLVFGYQPYLKSEVNKLENQIQRFSQEIPQADQESLASFYSQLLNLDSLLRKHTTSSPLFNWLEKYTQPNIYYTKFDFNSGNRQLFLSGFAKTTADFVQQLQIFQADPQVERLTVNSLTLSVSGTWQFNIILFLNPNLLSQSSQSATSTQ